MGRYFLYFIGFVSACASSVVYASTCNENLISIQISDEIRGSRVASLSEVTDPIFQKFASTITSHVESLLKASSGCAEKDFNHSSLVFVRRPLIQNRPVGPLLSSSGESAFNGCRLSSPWVDFQFENSASPKARGVILWSQRQLLIDQALMAGDIQASGTEATPLTDNEFEGYAKAYADLEILRKSETASLSSPIPSDILWLFRNSWQSTRGPFSLAATSAMDNLVERRAERYADLVINLIDYCVSSGQVDLSYKSVLDLKGLVPLDNYKINTLL